jgi:hypothetical protein
MLPYTFFIPICVLVVFLISTFTLAIALLTVVFFVAFLSRNVQISRLIYTNSGVAILALTASAVHLLWKWPRSDRNSSGKVSLSPFTSTHVIAMLRLLNITS